MADVCILSEGEMEKISSVLKRDKELRSLDETRIRQLRQEIVGIRRRAALRPGLDPFRSCARCLTELGRILNRGALCPACSKKVCKDCRQYQNENHDWICIYCFKRKQLKAISGEWMEEFIKLSIRPKPKSSPGEQVRKILYETQRKSLLDGNTEIENKYTIDSESSARKLSRFFEYEQICAGLNLNPIATSKENNCSKGNETNNLKSQEDVFSENVQILPPKISPWKDIDPEPSIPMRVDKSRSFGSVQQYNYIEQQSFKDRQSSDEMENRSTSTSSEVFCVLAPVPICKKRITPLKKQQAIPEPNTVEKQQSSVDTVDSGVFSPGLKAESSIEASAPLSPLAFTTVRGPKFLSDSSSSENESEVIQTIQKPDVLFRKVTLKKRKNAASKCDMKKRSATISIEEMNPVTPSKGLNNNFSTSVNNSDKTKINNEPTSSQTNMSSSKPFVKNLAPLNLSKTSKNQCTSVPSNCKSNFKPNIPFTNSYETKDGAKRNKKNAKKKKKRKSSTAKKQQIQITHKEEETFSQENPPEKLTSHQFSQTKNDNISLSHTLHESTTKHRDFQFLSDNLPALVRRASLPNRKTVTYDWLHNRSPKYYSLEDWIWFLEGLFYETKINSLKNILLLDEYKLIYDSSSEYKDGSVSLDNFQMEILNAHKKDIFHSKVNDGNFHREESSYKENSNAFSSYKLNKSSIQVNEANKSFVYYNLHTDKKLEQKQHYSSTAVKIKSRSTKPTTGVNSFLYQELYFKMKELNFDIPLSSRTLQFSPNTKNNMYLPKHRSSAMTVSGNKLSENSDFCNLWFVINVLDSGLKALSFKLLNNDKLAKLSDLEGALPYLLHFLRDSFKNKSALPFVISIFPHFQMNYLFSKISEYPSSNPAMVLFNENSPLTVLRDKFIFNCKHSYQFQRDLSTLERFINFVEKNQLLNYSEGLNQNYNPINTVKKSVLEKDETFCNTFVVLNNVVSCVTFKYNRKNSVLCEIIFSCDIGSSAYGNDHSTTVIQNNRVRNMCVSDCFSDVQTSSFESMCKNSSTRAFEKNILSNSISNPTWRYEYCGKIENLFYRCTANALHYTAFSCATNHDKDKSATGGGKQQCSTLEVIDLNLGVSKCGSSETVDLSAFRSCNFVVGLTFFAEGSFECDNIFIYHGSPAVLKPEVYITHPSRSDISLLSQWAPRVSGAAFMKSQVSDYWSTVCAKKFNVLWTNDSKKRFLHLILFDDEPAKDYFPNFCAPVSYTSYASRMTDNPEAFVSTKDEKIYCSNFRICENLRTVYPYLCSKENFIHVSNTSEKDEIALKENMCDINSCLTTLDTDILSCVKNIFCNNFPFSLDVLQPSSKSIDNTNTCTKKVDCQCYKPCHVPTSPSIFDATLETRTILEDGEAFSSGDELDKLESDTDSQDTVIEGEAYKRIRSVAIKEKILHANEELFGVSIKESDECCKLTSEAIEKSLTNPIDDYDSFKISTENYFSGEKPKSDSQHLLSVNADKHTDTTNNCTTFERNYQSFKSPDFLYCSSSTVLKKQDFCKFNFKPTQSSLIIKNTLPFNKTSINENICSSESSDNGSDGEECILSDTSTSSDEATYIVPSVGSHFYNRSLPFRLHTIVEESCEECDKSSRGTTPSSRSASDVEQCDKMPSAIKMSKRSLRKSGNENSLGLSKNGKKLTDNSVLASSRLEKYFKSNLFTEKYESVEEDLTDESGGISSDDETTVNFKINHNLNRMVDFKNSDSPQKPISVFLPCPFPKYFKTEFGKTDKTNSEICNTKSPSIAISEAELPFETFKPSLDEDSKYIMNHLVQHIVNNNDTASDINSEVKDVPMLKILESEIARLMLTVSPASLSTGEPSSSCSSTIGSNNSDYGSDTLESAEESSSDEETSPVVIPENRALLDIVPGIKQANSSGDGDLAIQDNNLGVVSPPSDFVSLPSNSLSQTSDSSVLEETLYICKQLMASLRRIADTSENVITSDEVSTNRENHSAKQYITDQIVSLMQTVSTSHNNPQLLRTLTSNSCDISLDRSDSDSPVNDEKRDQFKSKTPSESGSETTISASISIPSYDDSDHTPTESEISHEMDELYALLESSGTHHEIKSSAIIPYDTDTSKEDTLASLSDTDSPLCENNMKESCDISSFPIESQTSLLYGAASKLESLLPISMEERIARYKDAFLNKTLNKKENDNKNNETRINVILPQPAISTENSFEDIACCKVDSLHNYLSSKSKQNCNFQPSTLNMNSEENCNITSVKIISHNTYPLSSAIHKILSSNIESEYLEKKLDYQIVNVSNSINMTSVNNELEENKVSSFMDNQEVSENESSIISTLPKVINRKEKASSENDLLGANYRAKSKGNKVFGTKSVGNISELENINKNGFRDTGYYSFKSSEESFLSLDDSTASRTSTASLTQYRSLTSTETIPEEEEACAKVPATTKISLSSSNIPDAVCGLSSSKSSTLPLSLRNKLSVTPGGNHRSRSSFFSTSGVLRKLTLLRDESGNSLRSSPHGRLRMRNRSLSGGSEDGRHRKSSVPQISLSECLEGQTDRYSAASSEKDSSGIQEDEIDQAFAYHCRSQMSLSSFGGRSESVTSVYSAAGGGRYGTVTVIGEVLFSLNYNYKAGVLEVYVKECRNLAAVLKRNRSDPYVKIYLLPDRTKGGKRKTKVKKHTLNPVFDECLKYYITMSELELRTLWLSVWHSDRFGRNDFLGEVMLPLGNNTIETSGVKWYPLQERLDTFDTPVSYKGDIILALRYVNPDITKRKFSKKPGLPVKGSLEVLVREARNLMATRSNGTSDPFCKSYLLPDKTKSGKQKTPVFKKSCNPTWNHTFVYDDISIEDLRERCLELTIWDYDKITSNDFLGGIRLCLGTGKYQGRDVEWMDSIGEERSLWYTMLERPNIWVDGSLLLRPNMQNRRTTQLL